MTACNIAFLSSVWVTTLHESVSWQGADRTFKMDHLKRVKGLFTKQLTEFTDRDRQSY